jgi:hypothetical protein
LLTDFVCLYTYEFWLSLWKIVLSSVILLLPLYTAKKVSHIFIYLYPIYLNELEINGNTESQKSASYLDIHIEMDNDGRLKTRL